MNTNALIDNKQLTIEMGEQLRFGRSAKEFVFVLRLNNSAKTQQGIAIPPAGMGFLMNTHYF